MAIAYDASSSGATTVTNTLTFAHTCTGSDRILFVGTEGDGSTDTMSSVTYNGVALTQIASVSSATTGNRWLYLHYLIAPATGANNIVVTLTAGSNVVLCVATSYTGAKQTGVPDSSNTGGAGSGTSLSISTTTVLDNCWVVGHLNGAAAPTAQAGTTLRVTEGTGQSTMGDSNGVVTPAGAKALGITWTGSNGNGGIVASFAPAVAAGPANLKTYNTNATANIKSINTNLIANVKTLNTNA